MNKNEWEIILSSPPDREELVAEIWYKNKYWVEISAEVPNKFAIQFYNNNSKKYWEFSYEEAMEVLQKAKEKLALKQRTPEQQARYDAWLKKYENWKPTPEEQADYEAKMKEWKSSGKEE